SRGPLPARVLLPRPEDAAPDRPPPPHPRSHRRPQVEAPHRRPAQAAPPQPPVRRSQQAGRGGSAGHRSTRPRNKPANTAANFANFLVLRSDNAHATGNQPTTGNRMSTLFQPGQHPDADQLNAFVEHALPLHEQQATLAHLAACADCRAIVYLAQPAAPEAPAQPQPVPPRPWFSGWMLAFPAAAALACLIFLTVHFRDTTSHQIAVPNTAHIEPPPPPPAAPPESAAPPAPAPVHTPPAATVPAPRTPPPAAVAP